MPPMGGSPPAMPGQVPQGGKEMKGRLQAGLILALMEMAMPNMTDPEDKIIMEEAHLKMLKRFSKPPGDLQKAEMNFMSSQLNPMPRPSPMDQGPQIQQRLGAMGVQPQQAAPPVAA